MRILLTLQPAASSNCSVRSCVSGLIPFCLLISLSRAVDSASPAWELLTWERHRNKGSRKARTDVDGQDEAGGRADEPEEDDGRGLGDAHRIDLHFDIRILIGRCAAHDASESPTSRWWGRCSENSGAPPLCRGAVGCDASEFHQRADSVRNLGGMDFALANWFVATFRDRSRWPEAHTVSIFESKMVVRVVQTTPDKVPAATWGTHTSAHHRNAL